MDVLDIVAKYIKENGYDGLYSDGDCSCKADDLAPCGQICNGCEAGYIDENCKSHEFDFYIGPTKKNAHMK